MKTTVNLGSDYKRIIDIRACKNINSFDFVIKDQMLTAKNPDELQNKFQWIMSKSDLRSLRDVIDVALAEDASIPKSDSWIEP